MSCREGRADPEMRSAKLSVDYMIIFSMVMNNHSYLSNVTRLDDLNNIKMYTVDKQYKNRCHIGQNA